MDGTAIGMSRHQAYLIGGGLLLLAFLFATPPNPLTILDDALLNLPVAFAITAATSIPLLYTLVFTYTVIPVALFLAGTWVYPGPTIVRLKQKVRRLTNTSRRIFRNPYILAIAALVITAAWLWYLNGGQALLQPLLS